jgi:hypothetical protein
MKAQYRITHPPGASKFRYTLEQRGWFGRWVYVATGEENDMYTILDDIIEGKHDTVYFDNEGSVTQ